MSVKICPNGRNDIHGSASLPIIHGSDRRPCLYIPNMNFKTGNEIYPRHSRTQIPISPTNSPIAALWVGAGCVEAASCRLFLGCVGCHLDRALRREIQPSSIRQYGWAITYTMTNPPGVSRGLNYVSPAGEQKIPKSQIH
jgi:hypothetical protein